MYVHVRDQNDNATYASTRWVPTVREDKEALPCVRSYCWWASCQGENHFLPVIWMHFLACEDVAGGSQQSGGKHFFHEIRWPVRWVPAVRWRNHYFPSNKESLPCCSSGRSYQPLHVQYSSNGSRSLTTLTTPHREHQGGGRWRGLGRGRRGAGEDAAVDAHVRGVRGFTGSAVV